MSTILVVDDNPNQVQLLCLMLERMNMEAVPAYTGEDAIQLARVLQPNLIIMDIIMPSYSLDGIEAMNKLRADELTAHIPVIVCSSALNMIDIKELGYNAVLPKPYDVHMLKSIIKPYI